METSKKMQQALSVARANGGKLCRYPGGYWARENWQGTSHHFGTSTIEALVSRGLMSYSEWRDGRNGRFPIAAVVVETPNIGVHATSEAAPQLSLLETDQSS